MSVGLKIAIYFLFVLLVFWLILKPSSSLVMDEFNFDRFSSIKPKESSQVTNKKIAIVSDFKCPACKTFYKENLEILLKKYVENNKLEVHFVNFQFISEDSRYIAAMNTRVINEKPNLLYKLYQLSYSENMFDLSYKEFAKELFNSNFITSSHLESVLNDSITTELNKIDEDLVYVKRFGIRSVPTVILGNGKVLSNEELKNFFSLVDIYISEAN